MHVCSTIPWLIEMLRKGGGGGFPLPPGFQPLWQFFWEGQSALNDWACAHTASFLHSELPVGSNNY